MLTFQTDVLAVRHSGPVAAGTTDIEPANGVSTKSATGVCFVIQMGTITATAVTSAKLQSSSAIDGTGDAFADVSGATVTIADDGDDKVYLLELVNPPKEFIRCVIDRGTANAVLDGIIALVYGNQARPVTQSTASVGARTLKIGA